MSSANSSTAFVPNVITVTDSWNTNHTDSGFNDTSSMDIEPTMSSHDGTFYTDITTHMTSTEYMAPDYDNEYIYGSYPFERTVYLYIWEILVICTCLVNVIVISILVRKKMRNATNVILAAIAVSDSLTGLVTLPTYIMVYQQLDAGPDYGDYSTYQYSTGSSYHYDHEDVHNDAVSSHHYNNQYHAYRNSSSYYNDHQDFHNNTSSFNHNNNQDYDYNSNGSSYKYDNSMEGMDVYMLSKGLCQWFMMSKLFLSKSFHTISIYLTVCLGIQRFVSVAAPFSAKALTPTKALIACICVAVLSPMLHVYHFFDEKAEYGLCQWTLEEDCKGGCIYLWFMFFLRQFIPCTVLLSFTILFIRELTLKADSTKGQTTRRVSENRRIAVIVTAIVIVFLIAEIPYGFFVLYNAIDKVAHGGKNMDIELNRTVHMVYEILQVLSFHANFYIYTLFNRKFRNCLKKMFVQPYRKLIGDVRRVSVVSTSQSRSTMRRTEMVSMNKMSQSTSNST